MRILVLNYEYPPLGGGGGRLCEKLCEALAGRGHEIRVVTAGMRHLPRREERAGVLILRPESFRRREEACSVPEMGLYLATALPSVLREIRSWRPNVVHAHFVVPSGVLTPLARLGGGPPCVLTAHLGDVPGGVPEQTAGLFRLVSPLAGWIWRRAGAVTAVSSFVAGLAQTAWSRTPEIILNGIPAIPPPVLGLSEKGLRILFVGRLSIQKDPLLAIQALQRSQDFPWTLDVVGEGPLGPDMRAAAAPLGDRVRWHGWLGEPQVREIMARSDVLLMTSRQEGLPMTAVEALWHGLAIVGSRIGGLADVVHDGINGLLCERAPETFAAALTQCAQSPDRLLAMRRSSLQIAPQFDFDKTVSAYERILEQTATSKTSDKQSRLWDDCASKEPKTE